MQTSYSHSSSSHSRQSSRSPRQRSSSYTQERRREDSNHNRNRNRNQNQPTAPPTDHNLDELLREQSVPRPRLKRSTSTDNAQALHAGRHPMATDNLSSHGSIHSGSGLRSQAESDFTHQSALIHGPVAVSREIERNAAMRAAIFDDPRYKDKQMPRDLFNHCMNFAPFRARMIDAASVNYAIGQIFSS